MWEIVTFDNPDAELLRVWSGLGVLVKWTELEFSCNVKYQSVSQWIDIEKVKLPQGSAWDLLPVAHCQVLCGPNKCELIISCEN